MIIQHDAEETSYQDLKSQSGGGQYENREAMAAWNSGECWQGTFSLIELSANPRDAAPSADVE
jgi:hypothetical protein